MARYRLLAEHVTPDGRILPTGTEVGDGTPEPWPQEPSGQMDPLDADALEKVKAFHVNHYDEEIWHDFERAMEARKAPRDEPEEVKGPSVSKQQAEERGEEWEGKDEPAPTFTSPAPVVPASPQVRPRVKTEREEISPNKDQYPKD